MKNLLILTAALLLISTKIYAGSGDMVVNGNLGVGTGTPGAKLDVNGNINIKGGSSAYYGWGEIPLNTITVGDLDYDRPNKSTSPLFRINEHAGLSLSAHSYYGGIRFYNQGYSTTELNPYKNGGQMVMAITNGNVGIGTTSPGAKLDVNGDIRAGNSDIYFTKNDHNHTGIGNTPGYAAIENAVNYNTLMILGRSGGIGGVRSVSVWDRLDVNGSLYLSGQLLTISDIKFKKDIQPIDTPLTKLLSLNGVSYEMKTDEYKEINLPKGRHYGVIAEEIEKVLPEVVDTATDGTKRVAYTELIPVLIEAIKEQQKAIDKQNSELNDLKDLVKQLTSKK